MRQLPLVAEPPGSPERVQAAADWAARGWGLSPPVLLRAGMNSVFASGDVVLRVSRPTAPAGQALRLAEQLSGRGIRVPRPARHVALDAGDGRWVTAWERIEEVPGRAVDWAVVGRMVAALHAIDVRELVEHPLPPCWDFPWWDFPCLLDEVDDLLSDADRAALHQALTRHSDWRRRLAYGAAVVCHGDVHPGNVMAAADGPVLVDWDLLCTGPAGWDHAPLLTWAERWGGDPELYPAFATGYGTSLAADTVTVAIAELRLLAATLMRLKAGRHDAGAAAEAQRRLRWWREEPGAPEWQPA